LVFGPDFRELVVGLSEKVLELQKTLGFTYIAGSGNSGALVVAAVSFHTGIPMWIVRRRRESTHDTRTCNGTLVDGGPAYLIIDDLISSGATVDRIITTLHDAHGLSPAGVLTYFETYDGDFESTLGTVPTFKYTLQ
jgi:adenine/guanine phosphoribosyltransferase-like PRPP-binding protein